MRLQQNSRKSGKKNILQRKFNFHKIGLFLGIIVFFIVVLVPSPSAMNRSGFEVLQNYLPEDTNTLIAAEFGLVNEETFEEFLEYSRTVYVSTAKKAPTMISESSYQSFASKSAYNAPQSLYDLIMGQAKAQKYVLAIALLMALWWISEAIPVTVTALIPMVLFPLLRVSNYRYSLYPSYFSAFEQYSNYLIFLFLGGFVIAASIRKWGLDKRISYTILNIFGTKPSRVILGFMISTAFLSMWISNTATTALMMPVALAVLIQSNLRPGKSSFGLALMLSIAYAASIGGLGTLIGTPPNGIAAGFISQLVGKEITFALWIRIGLPMMIIFLPLAWRYILWRSPPEIDEIGGGKDIIKESMKQLGPLSVGERNTLLVFVFTAIAWATRSSISIGNTTLLLGWSSWFGGYFSWVHDSTISIFAIILLFLLPVDFKKAKFTMDWKAAEKYVPWGTLILFGGGLTLGKAIANTGMASWIASYLTLFANVPMLLLILLIVTMAVLLSEVTSNTATAAMLMPIMFALGSAINKDPTAFMICAAVATSLVFALPVATPPNAIVFGTGYVKIEKMAKIGILLDVVAIFAWSTVAYFIIGKLFQIISI